MRKRRRRLIKSNAYTRGQIHLFLEAERVYGFNDLLDWVKYGVDDRLVADELRRVRDVEMPRAVSRPATNLLASRATPSPAPNRLVLRGISWTRDRPVAIINDRTLGGDEQGLVHVGKTNVSIRCLVIRQDAVRIQVVGSGEEQELRLRRASP